MYFVQGLPFRWEFKSVPKFLSNVLVLLVLRRAVAYFRWHLSYEKAEFVQLVPDQRKERRENNMKKLYVKSLKEYDEPFEIEADKILAAMRRYKDSKKKPTSVALDERTIQELKKAAERQGIPYQVLIRVFILDGLERLKKAA